MYGDTCASQHIFTVVECWKTVEENQTLAKACVMTI